MGRTGLGIRPASCSRTFASFRAVRRSSGSTTWPRAISIDRDNETAAKLKTEKFHRVILELRDGSEVVIEGLGQAVFRF